MIIKLSNCEVELKETWTWGDKEALQSVFIGNAKIDGDKFSGFGDNIFLEGKIKLLQLLVVKIKQGDKEIDFTRDWVLNLSIEDGDKLYNEADKLTSLKKKSTDLNSSGNSEEIKSQA